MKQKLVLFDIDGTLLLSQGAGRRAILKAMAGVVSSFNEVSTVRFDGKTDPQIVEELFAAAGDPHPHEPLRIAEVLERYVDLLSRELAREGHRTEVMPGVVALLETLEADDSVVLGLLTGNVHRGAILKLRSANLIPERFLVGAFGSDDARRPALPNIAARRAAPLFGRIPTGADVVIIGDTPADIRCGDGIGARAVAVATGGFDVPMLTAERPHAVFESLADTAAVCKAILC